MLRTLVIALSLTLVSTCNRSERPQNAGEFYSNSKFLPGTKVNYVCDPGYELLGPQQRTCQSNGSWTPMGLPFCVADIAQGKSLVISSEKGRVVPHSECYTTQGRTLHFWHVHLEARYKVIILRLDFGNDSASTLLPVSLDLRVGDDKHDLNVNRVCSKFSGPLPAGMSVYFLCPEVLPGSYVMISARSYARFRVSICGVHAFSEQAAPLYGDLNSLLEKRPETSERHGPPTVVMALAIGAAACGVAAFAIGLLVVVLRATCRRIRRGGAQFTLTKDDAVIVDQTMENASAKTEPTLTSVLSTSDLRRYTYDARSPVSFHDGRYSSVATTTLPVAESSPISIAKINFRESRLL